MHRLLVADGLVLFDGPRGWIVATLIAVVVIAAFGLPLFEKVWGTVGRAAEPKISEHNERADAHPDIRTAVALLNQSIVNLQAQITSTESHRKESHEALLKQLQMVVSLLPKE